MSSRPFAPRGHSASPEELARVLVVKVRFVSKVARFVRAQVEKERVRLKPAATGVAGWLGAQSSGEQQVRTWLLVLPWKALVTRERLGQMPESNDAFQASGQQICQSHSSGSRRCGRGDGPRTRSLRHSHRCQNCCHSRRPRCCRRNRAGCRSGADSVVTMTAGRVRPHGFNQGDHFNQGRPPAQTLISCFARRDAAGPALLCLAATCAPTTSSAP